MKNPTNWQQLVTDASLHMTRLRATEGEAQLELWPAVQEPVIGNHRLTERARDLNAMVVLSSYPPISLGIFYGTNVTVRGKDR